MRIMAENVKQLKENGVGDQYQSQWIARWTQANSKPVCQSHQQYAVSYSSKEEVHAEERGHLEGTTSEPRKSIILKMDTDEESTRECNNLCRSDPSKIDLSVNIHQSAEPMGTEVGRCKFISNLMLQKKVKLYDAEVVSADTCFLHKMPNSNVNSKSNERSRTLKNISEWNDFLMVDSNKEAGRLLTPLNSSGTRKSSKEGLSLWRDTLASEEQHFSVQTMTKCPNRDMQHYKPVKCSSCCTDDIPGSSSHPTIHQYENQRQNERTSFLINEEEKGCSPSSQLQGNKENQLNVPNSRLLLSWEYCLSLSRSSDLGHAYELFRKMPNSSILDVDLLKMHNASSSMENTRGGAREFPNEAQSFFMTKKMCMDLSSREQLTVDLTDSTKPKGIALFEMLLPTGSKRKETKATKCLLKANSIQGTSSNGLTKDIWCSKVCKDQLPSSSLIEQATRRDTVTDTQLSYPVYTEKTTANSDIRISRREYKNTHPDTSGFQRPCLSNSSSIVENLCQADSCSRWLKRLNCKPLDSPAIVGKKYKVGDGPLSGEECCLLRKEINYKIPSYLKGKQVLHENMKLTKSTGCCSGVSAEKLSSWTQRWSHNKNRITKVQARVAGPDLCKAENSYIIDDDSEGKQFPSVAAMALMGRMSLAAEVCREDDQQISFACGAAITEAHLPSLRSGSCILEQILVTIIHVMLGFQEFCCQKHHY